MPLNRGAAAARVDGASTCPRTSWKAALACALLAAAWFAGLGSRALVTPDEGRYASIALGMLQSGDWITPRLDGLLYFEKPPLQYWITAASLGLFGIDEWAARLWPALSGYLTVLTVAGTAGRLFGDEAGWHAGAVAAGTTWIVANSHFLSLDMGLTFFLTLALCAFLLAQHEGATSLQQRRAMWACWAALAAATLTKGLVALVIPGATLVIHSLVQGRIDAWRRLHWLSGGAIYLALAAPWFIVVSLRNPSFPDFFFVREHFQRYLTDEAQRTGAGWYFVPILLAGFLPWTSLLPALLKSGLPKSRAAGAAGAPLQLLIIWVAFVFAFFSASRSKLPSYILPMFPALALLAGPWLARAGAGQLRRHLVLPALVAVLAAAAPVLAQPQLARLPHDVVQPFARMIALGGLLDLLCVAAAWLLLARGRKPGAMLALATGSLFAITLAMLGYDHYGRPYKSSEAVARRLASHIDPSTPVFSVRSYDQTLPFYLRRPVTVVEFRGELAFGEDAEPGRWVPTLGEFASRWRALQRAAAAMPTATYQELERSGLPMRVVYQDPLRVAVVKPSEAAR